MRDAARRLRRQPAYALSTIVILALGVGINAAVFESADAVLFRSRPFVAPGNVFALDNAQASYMAGPPRTAPYIGDWQARSDVFESVAGFARGAGSVRTSLGVERENVALVTPRFFSVIGRPPALGRAFRPGEEIPGRANVAIISDGLWRREFGASESAVGSTVEISGRQYTVIGVMPPEFRYPDESEVWLPLSVPFDFKQFEDFLRIAVRENVIVRARTGTTLARVQAAADAVVQRITGKANAGEDRVLAVPIREELSKGRRATFVLLLGMGLLLLAVAVANVANLVLARSTLRVDEIRVRSALGASRARIAGEVIAEPVILACLGGVAGALGARWLLSALIGLNVVTRDELASGGLDPTVATIVATLALASGVIAGGISTIALRRRLDRSLLSAHEGRGPGRTQARANLLAMQIALAFVLVAGSTLLARSIGAMLDQDVTLRRSAVTADISLAPALFPNGEARSRFADAILEQVRRDPDVRHAGIVANLPLSGGAEVTVPFDLPGKHLPASRMGDVQAEFEPASPGYFAAMGIAVTRGRDFSALDVVGAPAVAMISEDLADRFWSGADPIGAAMRFSGDTTDHVIVGVVQTVRAYRLTQRRIPQVYMPFAQVPSRNFGLVVDVTTGSADMIRRVRDVVRAVDPTVSVYHLRSFAQVRLDSIAPESTRAMLLGGFALLALVLAAAGVYGTTSFLVADRTREIGVRMALGAPRRAILQLAMREGTRAAIAGIVIGTAAALALGRTMSALLYGVTASDPLTLAGAAAGLFVLGVCAALVAASRALRVDPVHALRHE